MSSSVERVEGGMQEGVGLTELDALLERTELPENGRSKNENNTRAYGKSSTSATTASSNACPQHHRRIQSVGHPPSGPVGLRHNLGRHRRSRTSMTEMWGSFSGTVSGGLGTLAEGVQAEAEVLRGSFVQQLHDADEGRTFFLEMGMTRSLSLLPESISDFAEEAVSGARKLPLPLLQEDTTIPSPKVEGNIVGRYMALLGAVLAVSSNGAALSLLQGVSPPMKLYWRMSATAVFLCFFAVRTTCHEGFPQLTSLQWCTFVGAVMGYAFQMLLYCYALEYTSIGNAVIGANSQSILLIIGRVVMGHRVLRLEGGGVLVAFAGAVLCAMEESKDSKGTDDEDVSSRTALVGDLFALGSGLSGLGYLTFAKAIRPHMPVTVFMFLVMSCGSLLVLAFMLIIGASVRFSIDPYHGMFGWLNSDQDRIFVMLHIALVCNICGTMGFVRAMQYFDSIIISIFTMLEPVVATVIAYVMGVGDLPSAIGWLGNALVVFGTLAVVYPTTSASTAGQVQHTTSSHQQPLLQPEQQEEEQEDH